MSRRCAREGFPWPREPAFVRYRSNEVVYYGDVLWERERHHHYDIASFQSRLYARDLLRDWHKAVVQYLRKGVASPRRGVCSGKRHRWANWYEGGKCPEYPGLPCCAKSTPPPVPNVCARWPRFDAYDA